MSISKAQIITISLVGLLTIGLLSLDIKGLDSQKDKVNNNQSTRKEQTFDLSLEIASETSKKTLSTNLAEQINILEKEKRTASGNEVNSLVLNKKLAQIWDDVNLPIPSAFYNELIAEKTNTFDAWLHTGNRFTEGYQTTIDTLWQKSLAKKAIFAYKKALELKPESLSAKTKLGTAYVNTTPEPMSGITLLREVVNTDPKNWEANFNLGLFSMKSGQYQKAIERFKTTIAVKETPESWFYLASSYENLNLTNEAIQAYEKCKVLAGEPKLNQFIDNKIKELTK